MSKQQTWIKRTADDQIEAGKIKQDRKYQVNMKRYFHKKKSTKSNV
jgi:hypothetical protein